MSYKWNDTIVIFWDQLSSLSIIPGRFILIQVVVPVVWHHSPAECLLGCFWFSALRNKGAVNICAQVWCEHVFIPPGIKARRTLAGSYVRCMLSLRIMSRFALILTQTVLYPFSPTISSSTPLSCPNCPLPQKVRKQLFPSLTHHPFPTLSSSLVFLSSVTVIFSSAPDCR